MQIYCRIVSVTLAHEPVNIYSMRFFIYMQINTTLTDKHHNLIL